MYEKINLGCGKCPMPGFLNIDKVLMPGVDLVWDLGKTPLPINDNSVREVLCEHVLEHIENFIPLMEDIYRICVPGAVITVLAPYYKYEQAFGDPTHVRFFNERTFSFFSEDYEYGFYTKARFRTIKVELRNTSKTRTVTPIKKIRKFIPFKSFFNLFLWNMYSEVYYQLEVLKEI